MQCLEKEPERRPRSGAFLVRSLDDTAISGGQPAVPARRSRRRWRRGIAALITLPLLIAAILWWSVVREEPQPAPAPAIVRPAGGSVAVAIRPSMAGDERETAAARSLASELTTALSAVPGYRVASPVTPDASRAVGVDFLMEGTVQRERTVVRVNLRFIDARRDSTMWAIARQGSLDELFALQDSLSRAAVAALASALR
jgi:adenylate cyclase